MSDFEEVLKKRWDIIIPKANNRATPCSYVRCLSICDGCPLNDYKKHYWTRLKTMDVLRKAVEDENR